MNDRREALQALATCDQMEAEIQAGSPSTIAQAREMLDRWSKEEDENRVRNLLLAFRATLHKAANGTIEEILQAIRMVRNLAERVLDVGDLERY